MKDYIKLLDNITRAIEKMPHRVAAEALKFTKERFTEQSWKDEGMEKWKKRKTNRGSERRNNGAILVDSGRLKRANRIVSVSQERIVLGNDTPYAPAHNFGFNGTVSVKSHSRTSTKGKKYTVKAHQRKMNMPQRQFLGASETLNKRIALLVQSELQKAMKQ